MKALLLLTSILSISSPVYGDDYFSVTDNPFFVAHSSAFFKETESPIRNESILQLHTQGTAFGVDIQDLIYKQNYISFTDEQYDNYFSDTIPYRTTYFTIKVHSVVKGNVTSTILYEENYTTANIPFSIDTLNAYGTTYIDYTNATKNYIATLNPAIDYHVVLDFYFPIKNFAYPSQIGDEITSFVFDVYFSSSKHYAYLVEENYTDGYGQGYIDGQYDGYNSGFENGFDEGVIAGDTPQEWQGLFGILRTGFNSLSSILQIQVLPGFTLGLLLFLPLIFGVAYALIRLFMRGG